MKSKSLLIVVLAAFATGLTACSGISDSTNSVTIQNSNSVESDNVAEQIEKVDMVEVDEIAVEAEASLAEVYAELDDVDLGILGSVSSSSVIGKTSSSNFLSLGIGKKAVDLLDKVVSRFDLLVDKLRGKLDVVRDKVRDQMAKLDNTNPAHIALLVQLQRVLGEIDKVEVKLDEALDKLGEKVGILVGKLDNLASKLDMTNPLHWVALGELNVIRNYLSEVEDDLSIA